MAELNVVDWTLLTQRTARVGDLVSADAGGMPIYRIVALEEGRAWLANPAAAAEVREASLSRFCWKAALA